MEKTTDCFIIDKVDAVLPNGIEKGVSIQVEEGRIVSIGSISSRTVPVIDGKGCLLLPGMFDIHSDALETTIEPRPGAVFPIDVAIYEMDKRLLASGVTTIFHCVAFVEAATGKRSLRSNKVAENIARQIIGLTPELRVNTRIHGRYDLINAPAAPILCDFIENEQIHLVSFMDHTPGQGQFRDIEAFVRLNEKRTGASAEELEKHVRTRQAARDAIDTAALDAVIALCHRFDVPMASHDDDSRELVQNWKKKGIRISEFPVNAEALETAHQEKIDTSLGAPNICRGQSLSGNLSARDAIESGYGDIICSDYSPMALLPAVFLLVQEGLKPLHEAVNMVSLNPAQAVGESAERGSLEAGKIADLILVSLENDVPLVRQTFVHGKLVYAYN